MNRNEALEKARQLVSKMTIEEKASQLRFDAPAIERLGIPAYNWWNEALHGVARAGTATVFPQAIALAAIFDEDCMSEIADVISTEGRAKYNFQSAHGDRDICKGLTFWSPNINIFRDPRWGRGQETYGEDPFLTSRLGVRYIKGMQGNGKYLKTATCVKHMAAHSGPENIRHTLNVCPSEYDLFDTYLPAFEACVKEANVESVMGAYNCLNGEPCCGNKRLITDILRGQWGFKGYFISDCMAINDFHTNHKVTDTAPESAALAIKSGCDLNCGKTYIHLLEAYNEGLITEEDINVACERIFTCRYLLGMFATDNEYDAIPFSVVDCDEHDALALKSAERSMVLLKNDGILPIDLHSIHSVAVIGPNATGESVLEGNYHGSSSRYVTYLQGIRNACREAHVRVNYAIGSHLTQSTIGYLAQENDRLSEAVNAAECSDVSILFLGLNPSVEEECNDKQDLELPACQKKLLKAIIATGKPVVTVIAAGSALRVEDGNAILMAWYAGQAGGTAAANILFGKACPSGRLPITFYKSIDNLPEYTDYSMQGRTYRYFKGRALYPFGYGLSYTSFAYSSAEYDVEKNGVYVNIKNAGQWQAEEVAEVYVKPIDYTPHNLNWSLVAFKRVALAPGEEKRIFLPFTQMTFECVSDDGHRISAGHHFRIFVGGSQPDDVSAVLTGKKPLEINIEL